MVIRTCIGCRKRANIAELVRLVAVLRGDVRQVMPDSARRLPGRGAWLHPESGCLSQAERRNVFGRSLRRAGPMDIDPLRELISTMGRPDGDTQSSHARRHTDAV
ncbi:MAG: YlxR family protein [Mycobacteriales bacterium]